MTMHLKTQPCPYPLPFAVRSSLDIKVSYFGGLGYKMFPRIAQFVAGFQGSGEQDFLRASLTAIPPEPGIVIASETNIVLAQQAERREPSGLRPAWFKLYFS